MPIAPPNTIPQLSHAMTIRVNGVTIGAINGWNPKMGRSVTECFEFGPGTTGRFGLGNGMPFAKVPNNITGMTVDVTRYDLYPKRMEKAFTGTLQLTRLADQLTEFDVIEQWISPNNENNFRIQYSGCWFTSIGRTLTATGERVVNVSATLEYTDRDQQNA